MKTHDWTCPLCSFAQTKFYHRDKKRQYQQCPQCNLVFASPDSWPTKKQEKVEYDLHENHIEDSGYNRFLGRIVTPLAIRLPAQAKILDFGCGPVAALAKQLRTHGFCVSLYDFFYFPDQNVLEEQFDAITLTEVIEHIQKPGKTIQQLWQQLNQYGWLAIMTQRVIDKVAFEKWQYKNDPTHICFYSDETFQWLAKQLEVNLLIFEGRDMVLLQKR